MNFEIVELEEFSGKKATVYAIAEIGESLTLFDKFLDENAGYEEELKDILVTIDLIGRKKGVADYLIKEKEGSPGDGIIALYDNPDKNLRVYAIQFGAGILILGGGGFKDKSIQAWQEDPQLSQEVNRLKEISRKINQRIIDWEIQFSDNEIELEGDLEFYDEQDE